MLYGLSLLVIMSISPSNDIVISRLFWMDIPIVMILLSEFYFLEVALIVMSAIDDIIPLEGGILMFFLSDLPW